MCLRISLNPKAGPIKYLCPIEGGPGVMLQQFKRGGSKIYYLMTLMDSATKVAKPILVVRQNAQSIEVRYYDNNVTKYKYL